MRALGIALALTLISCSNTEPEEVHEAYILPAVNFELPAELSAASEPISSGDRMASWLGGLSSGLAEVQRLVEGVKTHGGLKGKIFQQYVEGVGTIEGSLQDVIGHSRFQRQVVLCRLGRPYLRMRWSNNGLHVEVKREAVNDGQPFVTQFEVTTLASTDGIGVRDLQYRSYGRLASVDSTIGDNAEFGGNHIAQYWNLKKEDERFIIRGINAYERRRRTGAETKDPFVVDSYVAGRIDSMGARFWISDRFDEGCGEALDGALSGDYCVAPATGSDPAPLPVETSEMRTLIFDNQTYCPRF